jgi:hypothetical protein
LKMKREFRAQIFICQSLIIKLAASNTACSKNKTG